MGGLTAAFVVLAPAITALVSVLTLIGPLFTGIAAALVSIPALIAGWAGAIASLMAALAPLGQLLLSIFSGVTTGLDAEALDPFIHNLHIAMWVLAATSLAGADESHAGLATVAAVVALFLVARDAQLARAGVRFRQIDDLQHFRATELKQAYAAHIPP